MIHEYNRKVHKVIFQKCQQEIIKQHCAATNEIYQEVSDDYFESEKFNKTLDIIYQWINTLEKESESTKCWPIFRDHKVHHILHFYPVWIKKNETDLSWQTPGKKSDWDKDWFMFAGSIWKNPKPGRLPEGIFVAGGNIFKCIRYKFITLSYSISGIYVTIDLKILNPYRRSDLLKNLGI